MKTLLKTYGRNQTFYRLKNALRRGHQKARPRVKALVQRTFDILASGVLLLLLAPIFTVIMLIVKSDGGPAFYSQTRIGRYGRRFRFWKFRSMVINADKLKAALMAQNEMKGGVIFKMKDDPRITPIGRIIRRGSMDELPQLWNVFIGDMSLVGPRPPLPDEVAQYNARERERLETNQGITCIWQVSGRNEICFEEQVNLDVTYIHKKSLWYDIKLLLKTLPAVISGRGAT